MIDAAKGVALLAANGGRILDYEGIDRIEHPIPPLIMMPSTSGTGADVSQFCIVTDTERHTKITIMGRALVPDVSVIDPRLLVTMPEWLNAATGLDALTHGIEAFVSLAHGPLTDHHALQAVSLVNGHLVRTMQRPEDRTARMFMAQAALEAGLAFTNAILGATHAMSHQVGGMLDLPHGVVNGVLLPHVIRFNGTEFPERFVPIAQAMGLDVAGAPATEAVEILAEEVRRLGDEVGVPRGLSALGVTAEDIPNLAELTLGDACLTTNPRLTSVGDVETCSRRPSSARPLVTTAQWPPRRTSRRVPSRTRPDIEALTGLRSGKPHYYPEYRTSAERLHRVILALERISAALVRTTEGSEALVRAVVDAAADHLSAEWVVFALVDGELADAHPRHLVRGPGGVEATAVEDVPTAVLAPPGPRAPRHATTTCTTPTPGAATCTSRSGWTAAWSAR